jgi:hypothetical protein
METPETEIMMATGYGLQAAGLQASGYRLLASRKSTAVTNPQF